MNLVEGLNVNFLKNIGFLMSLAFASAAWSKGTTMYVCTSESGARVYQNTKTGDNCQPLSLNPITIVPAPRAPEFGSKSLGSSLSNASKNGGSLELEPVPNFDAESDRMKILREELRHETNKLESLRAEYNDGNPERQSNELDFRKYQDRIARLENDIRLTQDNVNILKQEINSLLSSESR